MIEPAQRGSNQPEPNQLKAATHMTTQHTSKTSTSAETNCVPCDLNWLKFTRSPVATRVQTAQILCVDERTITKGINNGDIPAIRVGRRMLVPVPALRRLLGVDDAAPAIADSRSQDSD